MEVVGTILSIVQTLSSASENPHLKNFMSRFGYVSELEDLKRTVNTINAAFRDAEKKKALSEVEQKLIEDLKDVVYEADDLLDEFVTIAEQKQLFKADGSISEKMRRFISRRNPFGVVRKMSKGVWKIKKKLDAIAYHTQFLFEYDPEHIRNRRNETCSYVNEVDIIGRGEDLEKIVSMLLDPNVKKDLSFLGIYGIGGMGKTALAQLVFNDARVKSAFPLMFWACVSDQERRLDAKDVLGKILASVKSDEGSILDQKERKLQQLIANRRYLLVLDDVWTEDREAWLGVVRHFVGGGRGSWVMVTTRSQTTATLIGDEASTYMLKGLSETDSWCLFERMAFGFDEPTPHDDDLIKLGREVVEKCARVPLALIVVGSLLYRQDKSKWQSVK